MENKYWCAGYHNIKSPQPDFAVPAAIHVVCRTNHLNQKLLNG